MALVAQFVIARNEEHAVACGDAEKRYETNYGGDAHGTACQPYGHDATDEGEREIDHDDGTLDGIFELIEEQQEDDEEREDGCHEEHARCGLLALELAAILDVVALGQLDAGREARADIGDYARHVAPRHVGGDDNLAGDILTVDGVGACCAADVGDIGEWDFAIRAVDGYVADLVGR